MRMHHPRRTILPRGSDSPRTYILAIVSKAFTKETDTAEDERLDKVDLWPTGVTNYLTPDGHALLKQEIEYLRSPESSTWRTRKWREMRMAALLSRLEAAEVVPWRSQWDEDEPVRFGATVYLIPQDTQMGEEFTIVGVDEAGAYKHLISWRSPLARALMGKKAGEYVTVALPRGRTNEYYVMNVSYAKPEKL